ncbi:Protein FAR1-RELATED SEQUENCE 11 [Bienertia sinuspersici]
MGKGVVEVEVDAMVVELEDSSRILDHEAPVEERGEGGFCDEGGVGVDADVVSDAGCTPTKECSDVVALAPPTVGMVFFFLTRGYKAKDKTRQRRNAQWTCDRFGKPDWRRKIEDDSGVKTLKKCKCPLMIYASVNAKVENEWVIRKVVNEHKSHNATPSKSRFIVAYRKEEMNCHVKRKLKVGHSAGLKVVQIYNMLARERNGLLEMAINERDVRNELYREKKSTMPKTHHRWCIWNIIEEFSQKLGKCKGYNEFKDELLMPYMIACLCLHLRKVGWLNENHNAPIAYTPSLMIM